MICRLSVYCFSINILNACNGMCPLFLSRQLEYYLFLFGTIRAVPIYPLINMSNMDHYIKINFVVGHNI